MGSVLSGLFKQNSGFPGSMLKRAFGVFCGDGTSAPQGIPQLILQYQYLHKHTPQQGPRGLSPTLAVKGLSRLFQLGGQLPGS